MFETTDSAVFSIEDFQFAVFLWKSDQALFKMTVLWLTLVPKSHEKESSKGLTN